MPHTIEPAVDSLEMHWPIVLAGAAIGLIMSWLALTGDQQGMINIFYLLLIYLIIPVVSVFVSLGSLFFGNGINLARLLTATPLFSVKNRAYIRKIHQLNLDKYWFLYQSQAAAMAFSVASLIVFFTLLLFTDLNFVWRSTILEPSDVFPWLEVVALPWQFWEAAQPDISTLELTRDSRVVSNEAGAAGYGAWWPFILATQFCYSIILRVLLMLITRYRYISLVGSDIEQELRNQIEISQPIAEEIFETSPIVDAISGPKFINNWDSIPMEILGLVPRINATDKNTHESARQQSSEEQLLVVKAWEPPLGELEDFLEDSKGYLLPIDWNESGLCKLRTTHFHEWQRLINKFPNWQLYIPEEYVPDEC